MPKRRKKATDYLAALSEPDLPIDRRWALELMLRVVCTTDYLPPLTDAAAEEVRLRTVFECANCEGPTQGAFLFCSDGCKQMARLVRYVRSAVADRRIENPDVQAATGVNLLMLTAGGYDKEARKLSPDLRKAIFERDAYTCRLCGKLADQIDHISGSSPHPDNLRALCGDCNRRLPFDNTKPATAEESQAIEEMVSHMAERIAAPLPACLCDDSEQWRKVSNRISGARRRSSRLRREEEIDSKDDDDDFEDVDGYLYDAMQKDE